MKMQASRWSLVLLLPILFAGLFASTALADAVDPPARVARLSYAHGKVSFQPSGETGWSEASVNRPVTTGDRLYADHDARAELEVGPFALRLSENTDVTLANLNDQLLQLGVGQGTLRVTIYEMPANNSVEIDTPNGALVLQSVGSYRVDTASDGSSTQVTVSAGALQISAGDLQRTLQSGQAVTLTGTGPVVAADLSVPPPDDFDKWCAGRDRRIETSASMQSVGRGIPGGEDLDAYGQWTADPRYGMVWYPSNLPPGWVPYRNGHWAYVRPWGWTWVEEEPWGYAPFHYGRWVRIHHVWAWVPGRVVDRPVYAPALVVFVGGGGPGVQAWFPLGPSEPYTPWYDHGPNYNERINVVNVTNVTNIRYENREGAVTAVSGEAFRGGQPVASGMVHVPPEQFARGQIITRPEGTPTSHAILGAGTVAAPPVHTMRFNPPNPTSTGTQPGWRAPHPEHNEGPHPGGPPTTPPPHVFTRNSPVPTGNPSVPPPGNNVEPGKPAGTTPEKAATPPPPKPPAPPPPKAQPKTKTTTTKKDDHGHH
jgi:hypothetical protein